MLLQADASQLEWRVCLELSGDKTGLQEILDGQDTHSLNQNALELPSRLIAKIFLFRTIFRGSGWSFANDPAFQHVSADPKFWDQRNEDFYKKYFDIDNWHKRMADDVINGNRIVTPFGRGWTFEMGRTYRGELKIPWTVFSNYPVQGTGADVMMIARISFTNRLQKLGWPVLLISTVHDSIVVDCPDEYIHRVAKLFYDVFDDLQGNIKKLFGYDWKVPLDCECKFGPKMNGMKKLLRKDLQL